MPLTSQPLAIAWPWPRWVEATKSSSRRWAITPAAIASSPAQRGTKPGISPVANSVCRRSSKSRMVRITRYASSSWSFVSSPVDGGATADMRLSSPRLLLLKLLLARLLPGCAHDRVDVDPVRAVGEGDRGGARPLDLALAVEREAAGAVHGHRPGQRLAAGDVDGHNEAWRDRGHDACAGAECEVDGAGRELPGDRGEPDGAGVGLDDEQLGDAVGAPQGSGARERHGADRDVDEREVVADAQRGLADDVLLGGEAGGEAGDRRLAHLRERVVGAGRQRDDRRVAAGLGDDPVRPVAAEDD